MKEWQIPFIVFEIPSNLVMKKMLPSRFQSRIMVSVLDVREEVREGGMVLEFWLT